MGVQARFYVNQITKRANGTEPVVEVNLMPVTRDKSNNDWSKWTPGGTMTMTITQPGAIDWFESRLGKDVAITIEDRDPDETTPGWSD